MRRREFIAGVGGAVAWPLATHAQQPAIPVIGLLASNTESANRPLTVAFRQGLAEQGYVEGRNVEILYRWMEGPTDSLPALVADLVRRRVAVIVTPGGGTAAALAAKSATKTIPIVFAVGSDPVGIGLVANLNRPDGNITGATTLIQELTPKRLELVHEITPAATRVGFLASPTVPYVDGEIRGAQIAASILGVHLLILKANTPSEIEGAFANFVRQKTDALLVGAGSLFTNQRDQLAALAARHAMPTIYHVREIVEAGGLMSYGASLSDSNRLAGTYAGRILKGDKPADLPVQQSTKVELVINLKTAKALGLTFPLTLLGRADEVIE
jgi:putative ABC transport system substrate-binding protein